MDAATAGDADNFHELDGSAGEVDSIEAALTAVDDAGELDGTHMYVFVYDTDEADGYLIVDEDLDGTADYGIILTGLNAASGVESGDIV